MKIRVTIEVDDADRWAIGDRLSEEPNRPATYAECTRFILDSIETALDDARSEFFDEPEYPPHHQPH